MYQSVHFLLLVIFMTRWQSGTSMSVPRTFRPKDYGKFPQIPSSFTNLWNVKYDPFYPVADDDDRSSRYLYTGPKPLPQVSIPYESGERRKTEMEETLKREIKILFQKHGYKISDFRNSDMFRPNSSLFLDDLNYPETNFIPRSRSSFTGAPWNINPKPWPIPSPPSGFDEHSLIEYNKRIRLLLEENRKRGKHVDKNNEELNKKLGELMRVIREIEYDDFSEVLKLIQNLNQGYNQNGTNSIILIAMIQAAAQQWDETDSPDLLPPPFGTRNPSKPIIIPAELKEELLQLSNLLTKELKAELIKILARAQQKSYSDMAKEMVTIEEDSDGNVTLYIQNSNSSSEHIMRENLHAPKRANIIVDAHKESGNDDDDFVITEELVLDDNADDDGEDEELDYIYEDQAKKTRKVRENSGGKNNDNKNQVPYRDLPLENIIREEQRQKALKLKRNDAVQKEVEKSNVNEQDQDDDQVFDKAHRFSRIRTKRVRKSPGSSIKQSLIINNKL